VVASIVACAGTEGRAPGSGLPSPTSTASFQAVAASAVGPQASGLQVGVAGASGQSHDVGSDVSAGTASASPGASAVGAGSAFAADPTATRGPPSGRCPTDMADVGVACIDRYEAPNREGETPLVMQNLPDAEAWCRERGKRLCAEEEWLRACRGPNGWPYPYGPTYQEHACNHDATYIAPSWKRLGKWPSEEAKAEVARLNQAEPSGSRPRCVTPEGVFDLTGNVSEWVVRQHPNPRPHPEACLTPEQEKHRYLVKGCYWGKCYRVPHEPACDYVNCSHPEGFRSYEFGFRCCADVGR
jgi:formylglycine-generating enzyme required for sulfatase activity